MTSDPHAQALATLRELADNYAPQDVIFFVDGKAFKAERLQEALAILERPQALEGEADARAMLAELFRLEALAFPDQQPAPLAAFSAQSDKIVAHISDLQRRLGEEARISDELGSEIADLQNGAEEDAVALASAREENGKLREALRPFATEAAEIAEAEAEGGHHLTPDDMDVDGASISGTNLTMAHLRAARAVLASTASPETPTPERDVFVRGPQGPREGVRTEPSALRSGTPGGGTVVTELPAEIQKALLTIRAQSPLMMSGPIAKAAATLEAALRAALVLQPGWEDISTAPKDGTRVLGWNAEWSAPLTVQLYGDRWRHSDAGTLAHQPTRWMPLPPVPVAVAPPPAGDVE